MGVMFSATGGIAYADQETTPVVVPGSESAIFDIKPGDALYLAPEKRAYIW